uniref:Mucolipin TRP cation channel 3 n=1 Tax=Sinocyclocheilus grahami TaxID=75366 RepID=A0A672L1N2_SINGR
MMAFKADDCVGFSDMDDSSEAYLCINDPNGNRAVHWPESHAHQEQEKFRRKLKYFFMNPCDKYKARGRKPWKLILQIVKIAVVTIQLVLFGLSNQMVVQFKEENLMAFRHLFLKSFTDSSTDTYSVYTQRDVYAHIAYTVKQFLMLPSITVGNHQYEKEGDVYTPLTICQQFYRNGSISPANETFDIDAQVDEGDVSLTTNLLNFTLHFERLLTVTVNFTLKAINLETVEYHELPDCYVFDIMITFDNKAHSGRITIDLDNDVHIYECRDWSVTGACEYKSEHRLKPGSKFLFDFVDVLELKVFIEGNLDFSFYHSINKKILSTARKISFHSVFRNKILYKSL